MLFFSDVLLLLVKIGKLQIQPCNFGNDAFLPPLHFHAWEYPPLQYYILHPMKSAILGFSDRLVVAWKDSHALICLPHAVSFGMQFKSDHLIRQVVEIQSLELHFLWDFFFQMQDYAFHVTERVTISRYSLGANCALLFLVCIEVLLVFYLCVLM